MAGKELFEVDEGVVSTRNNRMKEMLQDSICQVKYALQEYYAMTHLDRMNTCYEKNLYPLLYALKTYKQGPLNVSLGAKPGPSQLVVFFMFNRGCNARDINIV